MTCLAAVLAAATALGAEAIEDTRLTITVLIGSTDEKPPAKGQNDPGAAAVVYPGGDTDEKVREQIVKRGQYIATNLAYNSDYGVLIEDRTLLNKLAAGAMMGTDDVVAVVIRTAKGKVLASQGAEIKDLLPLRSARADLVETTTVSGEPVLLFRAPVLPGRVIGRQKRGEPPVAAEPGTEIAGSVEVGIRCSGLQDAKDKWTRLFATLKDSYRLTQLRAQKRQTGVPFNVNDSKVMDVIADGPTVEITLIGIGSTQADGGAPLATYRVRIKEGNNLLAEQPAVAIARNARAIIGTRNGPAAPYLFLVLEGEAPQVPK
jgi:hypothetical protein